MVAELGFGGEGEVDEAEFFPGEEDGKESVLGLGTQGDGESGKGVSDGEEAVLEGDFALGFDGADDVFGEIVNRRQGSRHGAGA